MFRSSFPFALLRRGFSLSVLAGGLLAASTTLQAAPVTLAPWARQMLERKDATWSSLRFNEESKGSFSLLTDGPELGSGFLQDDPSYEVLRYSGGFDGAHASVVLPETSDARDLQELSVGVWIKPAFTRPRKLEDCGYLVSKNRGVKSGFGLMISYEDGLTALIVTDKGAFRATAKGVLEQGEWQHVGFSWDGKQLALFHNGRMVGEPVETEGAYIDSPEAVCVGAAADRKGLFYKGSISEVLLLREAIALEAQEGVGEPVIYTAHQSPLVPGATRRPRSLPEGAQAPQSIANFEDLSGWTLTGYREISEGKLERVQERALWGDFSAKISMRNGAYPDTEQRKLVLRPPAPIKIDEPFDAIRLWVFGTFWGKKQGVELSVQWRDADGKEQSESLQSHEFPFVFWRGWSILNRTLPETIQSPRELVSITLSGFDAPKWQHFYLGPLSLHRRPSGTLEGSNPSWKELGVDDSPAAIVPPVNEEEVSWQLQEEGGDYLFQIKSARDGAFTYRYRPKSGALSDITLLLPDQELKVAEGGGWELVVDEMVYRSDDARVTRELVEVKRVGDWVHANWKWSVGGMHFPVEWRFRVEGKSLVVESNSPAGVMRALSLGAVTGARSPVAVSLPYLVLRGRLTESIDPSIFSSGDWFLGVFMDWTYSRASELYGAEGSRGTGVAINGGSAYFPKTDGTRNAPRERFVVSASRRVAEVLPRIPNPPNRWLSETKNRIWATRMWYPTEKEVPTYFSRELNYWKMMRAYGAKDVDLRLHSNMFRTYVDYSGEPHEFTSSVDPILGGDKALAAFSKEMRETLGFRLGLITNYTLASPNSFDIWDEDLLSLAPDGNWRYGSAGSHALKPIRTLETMERYTTELRDKFGFNIGYTDQITCRPPWALMDYDARDPVAGQFAPVVRIYSRALLLESEILNAPIFSEGIMQWMYAGFADSYAQPGNYQETNFLVDFQHHRINPLSNDCGFSIAALRGDCYYLISSQLAYGNIGHLGGNFAGAPPAGGPSGETLKTYFLMRHIQPHYANEAIASIRYHSEGELLETEEAIRKQVFANQQVALRYENGTEVWVNRHPEKEWKVEIAGKTMLLPPRGFYALSGDASAESYSIDVDGRRVDAATSPGVGYYDGGGIEYDFGILTAGESYVLLGGGGEYVDLIPAPFRKAEGVALSGKGLPSGATGYRVSGLDSDGKEIFHQDVHLKDGRLSLQTRKGIFKYRIRAL